jgi:lipopolysaccharide export system permease protein
MLTMGQLQFALDSLARHTKHRQEEQELSLRNAYFITRDTSRASPPPAFATTEHMKLMQDPKERIQAYKMAQDMVRSHLSFLEHIIPEREGRAIEIAKHRIELHRKPMLAFACLLFFFIGAPLGAIVRKGGMGMPTVFAIVFFLIFFIVTNSTEQIVRTGELGAWPGMWISSMVLLPIGLILTWKAANDSPLMDSDAYARWWDNLRARFLPRRAHPTALQ